VIVKKETRHEEKTNSMDRANHNVRTAGGNHRRFIVEFERFSTSTSNAFFTYLGKRLFPL
jgi:hypothetical protein